MFLTLNLSRIKLLVSLEERSHFLLQCAYFHASVKCLKYSVIAYIVYEIY
jgi:hypothetical protein